MAKSIHRPNVVHVSFNGERMCNRALKGSTLEAFVTASKMNRCITCEKLLIKHGYSIEGLQKRFANTIAAQLKNIRKV